MTRFRRRHPLGRLAAALLLLTAGAGAQQPTQPTQPADPTADEAGTAADVPPELEEQAREIAASLRCPVCLGLSIEDSPSPLAREMKDLIRERLADGQDAREIRGYFVDRYGEWVLMTPEPAGMNLALWIVPGLVALLGAVVVGRVVRGWRANADAGGTEGRGPQA